ncbi:MAG TPA: carbohydrate ABC transporter permease [Candidatus Aerophobetes bacterium]|uniref:Carbohydrate ABC transporter permease n=1 Tax=Aerophobetes bacterium TaxID=2030807 RepID=A0A662DK78_UNCAE|nr:MAG: carbohydrate ABC transporter permease [Candidatus Aerophobetes bacterium]HDN84662.1 carbohydrate ABC transporter permease [Candidatus Aerophobetes bacterium]
MRGKKKIKITFIYLICILLAGATLFPIYWMVIVSMRSKLELFTGPKLYQTSIFVNNYYRPFFKDIYGKFLINSLIIATGNTGLVIFLAIFATYAFSRFKIWGSESLFFWTITNRMAPPAAFILPFFLIFTKIKLIDTHIGLILLYCIFNLPFAIWLLKGMIDAIPKELDEVASIDGCSMLGTLWHIILPVAKPGLAVTAMMTWIFSWNEYLFASVLTSMNARTITTGLAEFVTVIGTNWGEMAAVSVVCLLPAVIFLGYIQRYIITGLTFGAVKE